MSTGPTTPAEPIVRDGNFVNPETGEVIGPVPTTSDAMTTGKAFAAAAMAMEKLEAEQKESGK